ncbi:hypothetical protein AB0B20_06470 [Micromonospora sp. NPDC049151]|uniref:hypothetical protein n=1 Tax=Micromonospora sp. NPDC049151 TaxID=3155648 RepID=UPI0033FEA4E8
MVRLLDWIAPRLMTWMVVSSALILISIAVIAASRTGVDWGVAPAWAAFGISILGTVAAVHSARSSRTAAQASQTSAQTGVRQAAAAEEQVTIAKRALELAEQQALTAGTPGLQDSLQEALTQELPYVAWWIDQRSKNTYVLRNIGTTAARNVEIDQSRIQCMLRGATQADEVDPNASVEVALIPMFGAPKPNELWVRWDGHPSWQAVAVP